MGRLVLVPTPLGNLGDITQRAVATLQSADLIFAEDTRTSSNLLRHLGISKPLKAYHLHNEHAFLRSAIDAIRDNEIVVLVSDAGTPGISDPGYLLVRECIREGIEVECLPGPVALIPALVVSGFPSDRFCFEGFLPHKKGRQTRVRQIAAEPRTCIMYESPYRLAKLLRELEEHCGGERYVAVVREISKLFEECRRGTLAELAAHYAANQVKGEIVVVLAPMDFSSFEPGKSNNLEE